MRSLNGVARGAAVIMPFLASGLLFVLAPATFPLSWCIALASVGLLAGSALLGVLYGQTEPVSYLSKGLAVLALVILVLACGLVALSWLPTSSSSRMFTLEGQRTLTTVVLWPVAVSIAWLFGTMALLARTRVVLAVLFTAIVVAPVAVVIGLVWFIPQLPGFAGMSLARGPGWVGAALILVAGAVIIYLGWTYLFRTEFTSAPKSARYSH